MSELNSAQKKELRDLIADKYNFSEMKKLCADLGVEWEDISIETTRSMFAQDLVNYFERRGWLLELIYQVSYDRQTAIQNSGLAELINYNDVQDVHDSPSTSGEGKGCWAMLVVVFTAVILAIFGTMMLSYFSSQKLREPEAFVADYFRLLGLDSYRSAWEKLSGDYRVNKHPTGFTPYSQYWRSFEGIEILKIEVLEEAETTASVGVVLALTKPDSTVINQSGVYRLMRSTGADPWTIADSSP